MPVASVAPASIVHVYEPFATRAVFHVQATAVPVPRPRAATAPERPLTVTVHAAGAESLAVNRTEPPRPPTTCGAYSLGSPVRRDRPRDVGQPRVQGGAGAAGRSGVAMP